MAGLVKARLRKLLSAVSDTFWIIPGVMVLFGVLLAVGLVSLDRSAIVSRALLESPWLYNGGGTGARTLLGAVASSTIGVAGTVPYDNAKAESFMKTLKVEAVYPMAFESLDDVAEHLPRFIADIYNGRRLHSPLGYLSPKQFEDQLPRRGVKSAA